MILDNQKLNLVKKVISELYSQSQQVTITAEYDFKILLSPSEINTVKLMQPELESLTIIDTEAEKRIQVEDDRKKEEILEKQVSEQINPEEDQRLKTRVAATHHLQIIG